MSPRPFRSTSLLRAVVLATTAALATSGLAFADSLRSDGDALTTGAQTTIDVGEVAPGATVSVTVGFELTCTGTGHPDAGQSIALARTVASAPGGGAIVSVTPRPWVRSRLAGRSTARNVRIRCRSRSAARAP